MDEEAADAAGRATRPGSEDRPSVPEIPVDDDGPPPVPRVTLLLMAIFLVGGSLGLQLDWPAGPANVDWGVWVLVYGGYLYVVAAALFYVRTGK